MSYQVSITFLWIKKLNEKKTDVTDKSLSVFEKSKLTYTEENWLQKSLHYSVLTFCSVLNSSNKDQNEFYKGVDGSSTNVLNIQLNHSWIIHPISRNLSLHCKLEMYTVYLLIPPLAPFPINNLTYKHFY